MKLCRDLKEQFSGITVIALHGKNKSGKTKGDQSIRTAFFGAEYKAIILQAECLICFVNELGGAFNLMQFAEKNKILIINLAD